METYLKVHQMLKHIVLSQKNVARKKKCARIAVTERIRCVKLDFLFLASYNVSVQGEKIFMLAPYCYNDIEQISNGI
jgi:hypothetical protein